MRIIGLHVNRHTAYFIKIGVIYKTTSKSLYNDDIDHLVQALMHEILILILTNNSQSSSWSIA